VGISVIEMNWAVRHSPLSEARTSIVEMNSFDGYPTRRGRPDGSPKVDIHVFCSSIGASSSKHTSI